VWLPSPAYHRKDQGHPNSDDQLMAMVAGTVTMSNIVERRSADAESDSIGL
jgi:hypothetical protein